MAKELVWHSASDWDNNQSETRVHDSGANPGSVIPHPLPENGLVAYWPVHAGSGTTIYDYSGNGMHLTASSEGEWTNGPIGAAIGEANSVSYSTTNWSQPLVDAFADNQLTMSIFVYETQHDQDWADMIRYTGSVHGDTKRFERGHASANPDRHDYWVNIGKGTNGNSSAVANYNVGPDQRWYQHVARRDGSAYEVFVNGSLDGSSPPEDNTHKPDTSQPFELRNNPNVGSRWAEIAFWNRSLSDQEIADTYDRYVNGFTSQFTTSTKK